MRENKLMMLNYSLNKFLPVILVAFILFYKIGFETWEPYVIMGFVFFIDKFSYRVGYSVALCEERGLIPKNDE
tara:strand:+ start:2473 stop:2691 length:219 start_codon:yes stop_codon:yes gene_type:complete